MKKEEHAHIIGICGTAMASLAGMMKESGFRVTGSDANAYPPMSTQLEQLGIGIMKGYDPAHLNPAPDLVIIGNVCRRDNPEALETVSRGLPYYSMASFVEERYLKGKHPVVVAGTHGKTTTTSMISWLLHSAGRKPSFLVGGVPLNFGLSYRLDSGPHFVIEGDEYDTAYFDKGPKFLHYRPMTAVITSIEFDHADIYRDFTHYRSAFDRFISLIPADGSLVASTDATVIDVASRAICRVYRYGGEDTGSVFSFSNQSFGHDASEFDLFRNGARLGRLRMQLPGLHNVMNAVAASGVGLLLGLDFGEIAAGLASFEGVARRQQIKGVFSGVTVIDDFAHHPTAVHETIDSVRRKYFNGAGGGRLIAVFEPRSNTSRRNIFQQAYAGAFKGADLAVISSPYSAGAINEAERFNHSKLASELTAAGIRAESLPDAASIASFLAMEAKPGDVILIMSNGSFDNLAARLAGLLGEGEKK